ncbi:hypothetical protein QEN19_000559 [Hanseniaspora menglaensis]
MKLHKLGLTLSSTKSNKMNSNNSLSNTNKQLYIKNKTEDSISGTHDPLYSRIKKDANVMLDINIESPPCTMYGITTNSTGALLSGILNIVVFENDKNPESTKEHIKINNVHLKFVQRVSYERPFKNSSEPICSCKNCNIKDLELMHWDILPSDKPTNVSKGSYSYPFSQVLSGKLPQSCKLKSKTGVSYELRAFLKYEKLEESKEQEVVIVLPIQVTHAVLRGNDKNSVRIFPPTTMKATCTLPSVVYPKSIFPLELRLEGVSQGNKRWRMRSLNWKIEERTKMRQYACEEHKPTLKLLERKERERINKEKELNLNQLRSKAGRKNITQKKKAINGSIVNNIIIDDNLEELFTTPIPTLDEQSENTINNNIENNINLNEQNADVSENININNDLGDCNISRAIPANTSYNLYNNEILSLSNLDPTADFRGLVHPNDYQLRQELIRFQQSQRQWQIEQERNKDCSLYTEEIKVLNQSTIKSGWKSDFDALASYSKEDVSLKDTGARGAIELVTDIDCMSLSSGIFALKKGASSHFPNDIQNYIQYVDKRQAKLTCDVEDPILGLYVSHILVVEVVVAEEILQQANGAPIVNGVKTVNSNQSTSSSKSNRGVVGTNRIVTVPTGAARVLRMQFRLNFTERSGMGIPWNDEVPPFYDDVKHLSPPSYKNAIATTLNYEDLILKIRNTQTDETLLEEKSSDESDNDDEKKNELVDQQPVEPVQSINGNILGNVDMLLSPSNSLSQFNPNNNFSSVFNSTQ